MKQTPMEELFLDIKNQLIKEREIILLKEELDEHDKKRIKYLENLIYTPKLDREVEERAMNLIFKIANKIEREDV